MNPPKGLAMPPLSPRFNYVVIVNVERMMEQGRGRVEQTVNTMIMLAVHSIVIVALKWKIESNERNKKSSLHGEWTKLLLFKLMTHDNRVQKHKRSTFRW